MKTLTWSFITDHNKADESDIHTDLVIILFKYYNSLADDTDPAFLFLKSAN